MDENENDYNAWEDEWAGNPQILTPVHLKVSVDASGKRLDAALAILLPDYSRSRLQKWLSDGAVVLNGEVQTAGRVKVYEHDDLIVTPQPSDEMKAYTAEPMDLDIVYQDNDILVINKPAGLVVHPGSGNWSGTLLNGLLHAYPHIGQVPRAGIVHRLDKDTSGLMVVAKTVMAQTDLVRQLQVRTVKRRYIALVQGEIDSDGVIDIGIGRSPQDRLKMAALIGNSGKAARTFYQSMGFWRFKTNPIPSSCASSNQAAPTKSASTCSTVAIHWSAINCMARKKARAVQLWQAYQPLAAKPCTPINLDSFIRARVTL